MSSPRFRSTVQPSAAAIARRQGPASPMAASSMSGGGWGGWNYYEATSNSPSRIQRPFVPVDSRVSLNPWNRRVAMALARWAYNNVGYVRGAIQGKARYSVGTGLIPHSQSKDPGWNKECDALVVERFRTIDITGQSTVSQLCSLTSEAIDVDGDVGFGLVDQGDGVPRLQAYESHRIGNGENPAPNLFDGVFLSQDTGGPEAYNVALADGKSERIEAYDFIYLSERNRLDEVRSMTNLVHALNDIQDLMEVLGLSMEAVKMNVERGLTITTNRTVAPGVGPQFAGVNPVASKGGPGNPTNITVEQVFRGSKIVVLREGEELKSHKSEHPVPGLSDFGHLFIRNTAVGLSLPFEFVWNPEKIGGANTRMILEMAERCFQQRQTLLIDRLLNRLRFWVVSKAIKRKELSFMDGAARCTWRTPAKITADAGRDANAARSDYIVGLRNLADDTSDEGKYWIDHRDQRTTEVRDLVTRAQAIAKEFSITFDTALSLLQNQAPGASAPSIPQNDPAPTPGDTKKAD